MASPSFENGHAAEDSACAVLRAEGMEILARNFRCSRFCEADIIARDGETLVAVEVKSFAGGFTDDDAARKVGFLKRGKVRAALEAFAGRNGFDGRPMRVDALFVSDSRRVHYRGI